MRGPFFWRASMRSSFLSPRFLQWAALGTIVALAVIAGLVLGRDIPWDYYSYHAYSASQLFHYRLGSDYFAAGPQGYMNPIGFIPLALAQEAHLTSRQTGAMLAALHAFNYVAIFLLCRDLTRMRPGRRTCLVLGGLIAATSPILLIHLGSTFTDPIGSALVLFAAWLVITKQTRTTHFTAGFLLAASVAVKPTNAVYVLALCASAAWPWAGDRHTWLSRCAAFASGGLVGAISLQGYWSWRLYTLTGNPFFPFLNGLFDSSWLSAEAPLVGRFVPDGFLDALQRPWVLARLESWSVLEIPAPTIIPLAAAGALALYLGSLCWRAARISLREHPCPSAEVVKLALFVSISWCLWLYTSGNSRYAIALFLMLGPTVALLLRGAVPHRYAILSCTLILIAQLGVNWSAGIVRWGSQRWTQDWVSVKTPEHLHDKPYLYLSIANQSHSHLVRSIHPESAFIHLYNLQHSVPSEGPASQRLHHLISRFRHRTKVIMEHPWLPGVTVTTATLVAQANGIIDRVSLRIDQKSCEKIEINASAADRSWPNASLPRPRRVLLLACDAEPAAPRDAAERKAMERVFSAFERKCPGIFAPASPQIENIGGAWVRSYSKYDSIVLVAVPAKNYLAYSLSGQFRGDLIGTLDAWPTALAAFDCSLPFDGKRGIAGFEEELREYGRGMR